MKVQAKKQVSLYSEQSLSRQLTHCATGKNHEDNQIRYVTFHSLLVQRSRCSVLGDNFVSEAADDEQPSYAGCMSGTRQSVLSKFVVWVKENPMAIFWLAGMAGTGKTSIAVTLCRMLHNDPEVLLGAGYFCSRSAGSIARTDVRRILPTLAALIAGKSQPFAEALATQLENDRRVGHKPVAEQIDLLLRKPLAVLSSSPIPIVFVIDALDECSNELELAELLRLLVDFECDAKVKFILTSRPELHIRGTPISNPNHNTILQLHTISLEEVTSDIRLYISSTLIKTVAEVEWYTRHDIELLVKLSGGLFIFASTVLKYILDPDDDEERQDRLRKATSAAASGTAATAAIDKVYELVLTEASRSDTVDSDELERMKRILACILVARAPLSVEALASLIEIKPGRLRTSLRRLHSLVQLPDDDAQPGLRMLHASFGDYLNDRAPPKLKIATTLGHDVLARGCLRRMACDDLCFNISRSISSFQPNPESASDWIPLSLVYACIHWAHHIDAASVRSAFDEAVGRNFRGKFLFWLEVLSVLNKFGISAGLLRIASSAVSQFFAFGCTQPIGNRLLYLLSRGFFAMPTRLWQHRTQLSLRAHRTYTSLRFHLRPKTPLCIKTLRRSALEWSLSQRSGSTATVAASLQLLLDMREMSTRSRTLTMAACLRQARTMVPFASGTPGLVMRPSHRYRATMD